MRAALTIDRLSSVFHVVGLGTRPERVVTGCLRLRAGRTERRHGVLGHLFVPSRYIFRIIGKAAVLFYDRSLDGWDIVDSVIVADVRFALRFCDIGGNRGVQL